MDAHILFVNYYIDKWIIIQRSPSGDKFKHVPLTKLARLAMGNGDRLELLESLSKEKRSGNQNAGNEAY